MNWITELREKGAARFAEVGFPTTKQEAWRFTDVRPVAETSYGKATSRWTVDANGAEGLVVGDLTKTGDVARAHLGRYADLTANPFTALATAFLDDVQVVSISAKTDVSSPIRLAHRFEGTGAVMATPRVLIVLGDQARATVIETHEDSGIEASLSNSVTEIVLGQGATLDYIRVQREGAKTNHIATTQSHQGRDSVLRSTSIALGAGLTRHDLGAVLAGTGASLTLNGLSVLSGRQHVDYHTTIDHAQAHCESHELFNGVFDQQARGVFNGRIIVRPGAQRTDSKQTNNNLLLSGEARADSQPQLEIYADDVKCTHGATLGPLDPTALFYLVSRGLSPQTAKSLLTYGFAADVLTRIAVVPVRDDLDRAIRSRLGVEGLAAA
ncbi:MAG TPA: Fe-S cluster assembly protein SufD [Gemmatimonadales bacterium]|nr:Fe-S cluster assembly protein SufD [Gemmatimonadales bacterium]